jgi:hypothetical protein
LLGDTVARGQDEREETGRPGRHEEKETGGELNGEEHT